MPGSTTRPEAPNALALDCTERSLPVPSLPIRLRRVARRSLKWRPWTRGWSLWDLLTTLLARLGLGMETIQVLCVDVAKGEVLMLRNREYPAGWTIIQGLRDWSGLLPRVGGYDPDPRTDARRELIEEAVVGAPALADFEAVGRYREGIGHQFDCRVYLLCCDRETLVLRGHTAEGYPCWMRIETALKHLRNPVLTDILTRSTTV